jgi:hypothetical protein
VKGRATDLERGGVGGRASGVFNQGVFETPLCRTLTSRARAS